MSFDIDSFCLLTSVLSLKSELSLTLSFLFLLKKEEPVSVKVKVVQ